MSLLMPRSKLCLPPKNVMFLHLSGDIQAMKHKKIKTYISGTFSKNKGKTPVVSDSERHTQDYIYVFFLVFFYFLFFYSKLDPFLLIVAYTAHTFTISV